MLPLPLPSIYDATSLRHLLRSAHFVMLHSSSPSSSSTFVLLKSGPASQRRVMQVACQNTRWMPPSYVRLPATRHLVKCKNTKEGGGRESEMEEDAEPMNVKLVVGDEDDEVGSMPVCGPETKNSEAAADQISKSTYIGTTLLGWISPFVRFVSGSTPSLLKLNAIIPWRHDKSLAMIKFLNGTASSPQFRRITGQKLRQAEAEFFTFSSHLGKYIFIMMATGAILATGYQLAGGDSQEETIIWCSWLAGIIIGSMIGAGDVMERHCRSGPRNVVITGSTRGLGKALAREFLLAGDRVVITSRSLDSVNATIQELQKELCQNVTPVNEELSDRHTIGNNTSKVIGRVCDVSKVEDVRDLANFAVEMLGSIDIWINNAGVNKGFRPLIQFSDDDIQQIVSANLIGSLICSREAIRVMKQQPKGGHIFNMDGAGSAGSSTPLTAVYGSTKCGLRQFHTSLLKECKRSHVGIHTASPGMVLTDLLLSGASLQNKKMFNIICELPETVARSLVPRMREIKGTGKPVDYLTPPRILIALITAWVRRGRWFDEEGRAVYSAEADRVRNWAESRTRFSVAAAMDQFSNTAWVSVFSISVVCAFIMLSSSGNGISGT